MGKIPVVLINGFLGSGKTTLVRQLLQSPSFSNSFLIENEYASVNIDREALTDDHAHDIYEISGSCICCSTGEELEQALATIAAQEEIKPVIIEATGMANSAMLLQRLFLNTTFTEKFDLLCTVLLIDATETSPTQLPQALTLEIRISDIILINKSDLAPENAKNLESIVQQLNPEATILTTNRSRIDPQIIAGIESKTEIMFASIYSELAELQLENLSYTVLDLDTPLTAEQVTQSLTTNNFPTGVALKRAKGFFTDPDGVQWQVEATAHHIEIHKVIKPKKPVLVVIGQGITKDVMKVALI